MSGKLPPAADFWGIGDQEARTLIVITYWYNGRTVEINGEERSIATDYEPSLEELFEGSSWHFSNHERAHQRLLDAGLLKEEYICRRKVDWCPTQEGLQAIRYCLEPWSAQMSPDWVDDDDRDDGPLFGDPNEGLLHRKGVEVAGWILPSMAWAWDIATGREYGVEWYPGDGHGRSCHDLHVDTKQHMRDVGVEVVTRSNNTDHVVEKWERLQAEERLTLWIFDNRETGAKMWNDLHRRGKFHLDGMFQNTSNWSADVINQKIRRSSQKYRGEEAGDLVQTVTGRSNIP